MSEISALKSTESAEGVERRRTASIQAAVAIPMFAISAMFVVAALLAPNGVLSDAPTVWGAGKFVAAIAFFLMGMNFRRAGKAGSKSNSERNEN